MPVVVAAHEPASARHSGSLRKGPLVVGWTRELAEKNRRMWEEFEEMVIKDIVDLR